MPDEEGSVEEVRRHTIAGAGSPAAAPLNQLPVLLVAGPLIWRSGDAAVAVLALEVYASGLEFTVTGRIRNQGLANWVQGEHHFLTQAVSGHSPGGLKFSVRSAEVPVPVEFINGSYDWRGSFRCRAWAVPPADALTFALEWPVAGITYAQHEVTGLRAAAQKAITLWPG